jgi:hypothetical protein
VNVAPLVVFFDTLNPVTVSMHDATAFPPDWHRHDAGSEMNGRGARRSPQKWKNDPGYE